MPVKVFVCQDPTAAPCGGTLVHTVANSWVKQGFVDGVIPVVGCGTYTLFKHAQREADTQPNTLGVFINATQTALTALDWTDWVRVWDGAAAAHSGVNMWALPLSWPSPGPTKCKWRMFTCMLDVFVQLHGDILMPSVSAQKAPRFETQLQRWIDSGSCIATDGASLVGLPLTWSVPSPGNAKPVFWGAKSSEQFRVCHSLAEDMLASQKSFTVRVAWALSTPYTQTLVNISFGVGIVMLCVLCIVCVGVFTKKPKGARCHNAKKM